jgi:acyl-CoA thioester hydrolase
MVRAFSVEFRDVDMLGHANSVAYLTWAETARADYQAEILREKVDGERAFVIGRLDFTYREPLFFRDDALIGIRISRLGGRSFDFSYQVWSAEREVLAAEGMSSMIAYDSLARRSIEIPDRWRELVAAYERQPVGAAGRG